MGRFSIDFLRLGFQVESKFPKFAHKLVEYTKDILAFLAAGFDLGG